MKEMRKNVASMEKSTQVMPTIIHEVNNITSNVVFMGESIDSLVKNMNKINFHMSSMDNDIMLMSQTIKEMDATVHRIDVDIDNLSSPMSVY